METVCTMLMDLVHFRGGDSRLMDWRKHTSRALGTVQRKYLESYGLHNKSYAVSMGVMYYSHVDIGKVQRMTDQRGNQQNEPVVANFYSGIQSHYDSGATL